MTGFEHVAASFIGTSLALIAYKMMVGDKHEQTQNPSLQDAYQEVPERTVQREVIDAYSGSTLVSANADDFVTDDEKYPRY